MKIKSHIKDYDVYIENDAGFLDGIISKKNTLFAIDAKVYSLYQNIFSRIDEDDLFLIEAAEEKKTIETALDICSRMTVIPAKRNATIVSVGGGIVQDITGFAANVTYRGIHWIYMPTTLLAACDSCIGGKTSLNYNKFKNLLGTFYPPDEIYIWADFFKTLSDRDFKSGLGEVVKFNIMSGKKGLIDMEECLPALIGRDPAMTSRFVKSSLEYKRGFIENDEFDKGERIKLNFAHTFGHAIEVVTEYEIPHGTAVAIGMIMANSLSYGRGILEDDIRSRSEKLLFKIIDIDLSLLEKCSFEDFISAIRKDKKQVDNNITAVLLSKYGDVGELSIVHDVTKEEVKNAVQYFITLYGKEKYQ